MEKSQYNHCATRKYFYSGSMKLSYLEFGEENQNVLLMLHGHMNDARSFKEAASKISDWRLIGLDQRGHGWSDHSRDMDYSRESYLRDVLNFIRTVLDGQPVVILGHSLGGINAYQFAARHPEYVKAVIVEDMGVETNADMSFVEKFPERSASLDDLKESIRHLGVGAVDYFAESVFKDERGWGFMSDLKGVPISAQNTNGDWWGDWLASSCPIMLIHGGRSFALNTDQAELMASRRPNTELEIFEQCGHGVHSDDSNGFYKAVKRFLDQIKSI